jgi:hypothetical protein
VSSRADFSEPFLGEETSGSLLVSEKEFTAGSYHWKVVARNEHGRTESEVRSFRVDPQKEPLSAAEIEALVPGPDGLFLAATLAGSERPRRGILEDARGVEATAGPGGEENGALRFDGKASRVRYRLPYFPGESYTVAVWAKVLSFPKGRIGQILSAWAAGMDDPLRVCVDGDRLFARIEAGRGYSTEGAPIAAARWMHVAAVKEGPRLHLYLDGKRRSSVEVPRAVSSSALNVALGANPNYVGNEYLEAALADFRLYARALSAGEVEKLAQKP